MLIIYSFKNIFLITLSRISFWERLTRVIFFSVIKATDPDQNYKEDFYIVYFSIVKEDLIIEARLENIKRVEVESAEIISAEIIYYIVLVLYSCIRIVETARAVKVSVSN